MKPRDILIVLTTILVAGALGAATKIPLHLQSFSGGEMSPLMNARSDYPKFSSGAQTLQNMLVRTQGPIQRRPGTKYIATVKDSSDPTRLIPFEYSTSDAYVIELGDDYARFYRNGAQVLDANSNAYEIVTPWDANDLFELQFAQNSQYMRVVHPDYAPYKLTRTAHTSWTCTEISFEDGPFIQENEDTDITLTPTATTGDINIVSSEALFDSDHVGALWRLTHPVDANTINGQFTSAYLGGTMGTGTDANSATLAVAKNQDYTAVTAGYWIGTLYLQKSYDDGVSWRNVYVLISPAGTTNLSYSGTETLDDAIYRLHVEDHIGPIFHQDEYYTSFAYTLNALDYERQGIVEITAVTDACNVEATVLYDLGDTSATYKWAEGYWSTYRGFPRTVEFYEERCIYGGSESFPQTVWASIVADTDDEFDDFSAGTGLDDDAWTYILPGMNPIQWLKAQTYLMVGTSAAIGRLGTESKALTPSWVEYKIQAKTGCAYMQPVQALDALLFVERGLRKVREIQYTYTSEHFTAADMTILAEHITDPCIVEIDWQQRPDPILWCVRGDGQLLTFTYQPQHNVEAWAAHTTGTTDDFNSVAIIPGDDEDVVYAMVRRDVDGASVGYVEYFQPFDWGSDQNDCWYVDSGATDFNSLDHLEGQTAVVWADGRPVDTNTYTVSSGALSPLPSGYTNTTAGLAYTSIYESMPLVGSDYNSSLLKSAVLEVKLDFLDTLACNLGRDSTDKAAIHFSDDDWATTIDAFTGIKTARFPRGVSRTMSIYMDADGPEPWTMRGISPVLEVYPD